MEEENLIVIDTDCGLDDAQALMLALSAPHVKIAAITCVAGNTSVENACRNVFAVLKLFDDTPKIPVFRGCTRSLLGKYPDASPFHGKDGLGDFSDRKKYDVPSWKLSTEKEHAVNALVRLANAHNGKLTLITLGPLTNIATALQIDEEFGQKLKACYIMGGNYLGKGNVTASAEFNFHFDPEAAFVVLDRISCPITIATWELCLDHGLSFRWYNQILQKHTKKSQFLADVENKSIKYLKSHDWPYLWCDQHAMILALNPFYVLKKQESYCTVELTGVGRGRMVVDWFHASRNDKRKANVKIITKIDAKIQKKYGERMVE